MSDHSTPPVASTSRRSPTVRVALVVAVLVAASLGIAGYVAAAAPPFTLDTPRDAAPVESGQDVPVTGQAGGIPEQALFLFTAEPAPGGGELYTIGERPRVDAGDRWSGSATVPEADAVRVVAVRADPICGSQLAEMAVDPQASGSFFGPLPPGCTELASRPVPVVPG